MSLHPSLRGGSQMKRHRSVLSRLERLKLLLAKGTWNDAMSPLGLPKIKNLKVKVKKEKAAAPDAAAGAAPPGAGAAEGAKPTAGAKPATGAKPAAAKAAAAPVKPDAKKKA